jgi:6-carboxyhexanoate--CoA ligase
VLFRSFCVSDDPHYVTGYVATRAGGYVRITCLKEDGDANGGRIFLFRGDSTTAARCIEFLEHTPVLVHRAPLIPPAPTETSPSPTTRSGAAAAPDKWRFMRAALTAQREQNLCRSLTEIATPPAPTVQVAGRSLLLLASNNYLDLANEPRVKEAAAQAALTYGAGSGGARLLTGNQPPHSQLERQLAAFKGVEAALLFSTGYQANVGTIAAIADAEWTIFSDELNHASIIDGCRLSKAKIVVYPHNNMTALRTLLTRERPTRGLIVSDAVFSMDGDIVDLPALLELSDEFNLLTLLDEAHATGVLGVTGRGVCEHFNLSRKPDIIIGTGSKALGSIGGFAAGSRLLIDFLLNRARSFIFSTALPASAVAATAQALTIIENEPWRVAKLQTNRQIFCRELQTRGLLATGENLAAPGSAIIPIIVGDEAAAMRAAQELLARGVFLSAIRYPTVARGQARLRVALSAGHSAPDLITAAQVICDVVKAPAR